MCKNDLNIHFCTCKSKKQEKIVHNKNSRRFKRQFDENEYLRKKFTWVLSRYIKEHYNGIDGLIYPPDNKLTEDLTLDFFLQKLNSDVKLFDFEYIPKEGDNLVIRTEYINKKVKNKNRDSLHEYLSFIYKENKWISDFYNFFYDQTEDINEGILKLEKL